MSTQNYYVPDQSRFPIFIAFSLFLLVMGASSTINNIGNAESNSVYILYTGFACLFTTLFFWFRQVIQEHIAGLDSNQLKTSYVYGMAWFIFSEVMFFAAFFGALFYVRTFAVPWLAGEGEKGVGVAAIELWKGFESTWPVISTPDQGVSYELADKSMAWPGWGHALEWLPMWNTIVLLSSSVTVHFAHLGLKNGNKNLNGIFITHAHIGHYSGLTNLGREVLNSSKMPLFLMPKMTEFISTNGPWDQLVKLKNVELKKIFNEKPIELSEGLSIIPFKVPHRDEYSETVGFKIIGPKKSALVIPDIDKWDKWDKSIKNLITEVDYAFLDGTFYDSKEINNRDISEIPHPFIIESLELFKDLKESDRNKIYYIHLNHTNPLLNFESEEYQNVVSKGYNVATEGLELEL